MITVSKENGDFKTISAAVAHANEGDRIFIKQGIYNERVEILKNNITLEGENPDNTVITCGYYAKMMSGGEKLGTFRSYTLLVNADGVLCKNVTIENSAGFGSEVGQAVAVYAEGDKITFENCKMLGHQDTLFTGPLPFKEYEKGGFRGPTEFAERRAGFQLYRNCTIKGEVDFIFGSAHALFEGCELHSLDCGKEINGYVTAASTYDGEEFGYIFRNCRFTSNCSDNTVYLGRPWRNFAQVTLIDCQLGGHIKPELFHDWDKKDARKTVKFSLYGCCGDGFKPHCKADFVKILTESEKEKAEVLIKKYYGL